MPRDLHGCALDRESVYRGMPRECPAEFRRKVLDLVKTGRPVWEVARDLEISGQTIYMWRRLDLIDSGQVPGVTSSDRPSWSSRASAAGERSGGVGVALVVAISRPSCGSGRRAPYPRDGERDGE
jgi:hypothetical protein